MNKAKKKTYDDDSNLENILSPRCEFHVSPGFKERVMAEAKSMTSQRHIQKIRMVYGAAAAAVAALIIASIFFMDRLTVYSNSTDENPSVLVSALSPVSEIKSKNISADRVEIASAEIKEINAGEHKTDIKRKIPDHNNVVIEESAVNIGNSPAATDKENEDLAPNKAEEIEGPMATRSCRTESESGNLLFSADNYGDYMKMIRNAYIERIRMEIAETDEYVKEMREFTSIKESI